MSFPRISIITCTYNSEAYLQSCIDSVKGQRFTDYEHVFIDGYSKDRTIPIIQDYLNSDNRVKLYQAEPAGIANAMNLGISKSSGEIIQHLHSNDLLYDSESLAFVDSELQKDREISVLSGRSARLVNGELYHRILTHSKFRRRKLLLKYMIYITCYINHPSTFLKREVFERNGNFNENFRISMDYEFWLRIIRKERFHLVNKELAIFREHSDAASSNPDQNSREERLAQKLHSRNLDSFIGRYILKPVVSQKMKLNSLMEDRK